MTRESIECPLCGKSVHHPLWPSVRTTTWSDDCGCSDYGFCMLHRMSDEEAPPKRPSEEEMKQRAQKAYERQVAAFEEEKARLATAAAALNENVELKRNAEALEHALTTARLEVQHAKHREDALEESLNFLRSQLATAEKWAADYKADLLAELEGNKALREKYGAKDSETMLAFWERIVAERDNAILQFKEIQRLLAREQTVSYSCDSKLTVIRVALNKTGIPDIEGVPPNHKMIPLTERIERLAQERDQAREALKRGTGLACDTCKHEQSRAEKERDAALAELAHLRKAYSEHSRRINAATEAIDKSKEAEAERAEAFKRTISAVQKERDEVLAELKYVRDGFVRENESNLTRDGLALKCAALQRELDAAWAAADTGAKGMVSLAERVADLRKQRDMFRDMQQTFLGRLNDIKVAVDAAFLPLPSEREKGE